MITTYQLTAEHMALEHGCAAALELARGFARRDARSRDHVRRNSQFWNYVAECIEQMLKQDFYR